MAPKNQATIEDVARIAGVSIATVSRAVHSPERVAKTTRQKVNQAILVTGYTTNAMARSLRMGRSNIILVLAPDIGDPNFSSTLIGIETEARARNHAILIGHTQNDPQRAIDYLRYTTSHKAAGLVLFTGRLPLSDAVSAMPLPPTIAVFEPVQDAAYPYVGVDDIAGGRKATEHLLAAGHRKIAFVGDTQMRAAFRRRRAGFDLAMDAARVDQDNRLIVEGDGSIESGRHAVELLFMRDTLPTAFMCVNDTTAIGVMNALAARGYNVPLDFSVTGFDDVPQATYISPALTTIRQPRSIIGKTAIERLMALIEADHPATETPKEDLISPDLVLRGSVTTPRQTPI
ncbi:LacI family DNA-binding transcriptional regulator [Celeribacter arenosi]|uniref:LacI family DNA-binding transcriptional regulator n=1 Tax=Celeribacter arenosi TaxID=792649 RepID=A0ABP7JWD0_9RHOB